jgi:hypothetical protein
MARPKTGAPVKRNINLTVDEETREKMKFLSEYYGKSISSLVAEWTEKERAKIGNTNSALNISRSGKKKGCSNCRHYGSSSNFARCSSCSPANGYIYWEEKEKERKREGERRGEKKVATDINVGGKEKECFTCKHFGSSKIGFCYDCSEKNGLKHWEEDC